MSVVALFDRGWRIAPHAVAYRMAERTWTYDEVRQASCRVANVLAYQAPEVRHVGVLATNDPTAWHVILGAWRAGRTWVSLNPAYPASETADGSEAFDIDIVCFHAALLRIFAEVAASVGRDGSWICLDSPDTPYPSLAWVVSRAAIQASTRAAASRPPWVAG